MQLEVSSIICTECDQDSYGSEDEMDDFNLMDTCAALTYTVEIGEFHERDKFSWTEVRRHSGEGSESLEGVKKVKNLDFDFKMNHIKQVIRMEVTGKFKHKTPQNSASKGASSHQLEESITDSPYYTKSLYSAAYSFARCIQKRGILVGPQQTSLKVSKGIDV